MPLKQQQPVLPALQLLEHGMVGKGDSISLPAIRVQPCGYDASNNEADSNAGVLQQQLFHPLLPMPRSPAAVAAAERAAAAAAELNNAAAAAMTGTASSSNSGGAGTKYPRDPADDDESEQAAKRRRRRRRLMQLSELRLNGSLQMAVTGDKLAAFSQLVRLEVAGCWSFDGLGAVQLPLLKYLNLAGEVRAWPQAVFGSRGRVSAKGIHVGNMACEMGNQ
jgi:hypothetical protein